MDDRGFDAVFVGTGAGLPSYLGIEGEGLNGVMVASELLTRVNLMKAYEFPEYDTPVYAGKSCVVVGGGNVAMDAARTARRLGADVTRGVPSRTRGDAGSRRGDAPCRAGGHRVPAAHEPGARCSGDDEGWVRGLECVRMELGEPDASGRRRPDADRGQRVRRSTSTCW